MQILDAPAYTDEEKNLAVASLLKLRNQIIIDFISPYCSKKPANKNEMLDRIKAALDSNSLTYPMIFEFLDNIEAWGKQHVVLFTGPTTPIDDWKTPAWVTQRVASCGFDGLLNAKRHLALPGELTLSSIEYDDKKLRIVAVERREGAVRDPELDEQDVRDDDKVIFKAYRFLIYRGFITFEWDLVANEAFVQITQLPSGEKYEDALSRFETILNGLITFSSFSAVSLRHVIRRLHELEEQKIPEVRSHGVAYRTPQGRTLEGRGATGTQGLMGEEVIDKSMASVRKIGVGHTGNYYWLPFNVNSVTHNILTDEVHVALIGDWNRINFSVIYPEGHVRYVLQRIRALAAATP